MDLGAEPTKRRRLRSKQPGGVAYALVPLASSVPQAWQGFLTAEGLQEGAVFGRRLWSSSRGRCKRSHTSWRDRTPPSSNQPALAASHRLAEGLLLLTHLLADSHPHFIVADTQVWTAFRDLDHPDPGSRLRALAHAGRVPPKPKHIERLHFFYG